MGTGANYKLVLAHWELQAVLLGQEHKACLGQWHLAGSGTVCTASPRSLKTTCEAGGLTLASEVRMLRLREAVQGPTAEQGRPGF